LISKLGSLSGVLYRELHVRRLNRVAAGGEPRRIADASVG